NVARGFSNLGGWDKSGGDYGALGLATLAGLADLGIPGAAEAREKLLALNPPFTDAAARARDPLLNVVAAAGSSR
ncbi:hypothetical protein, partial [Roseomonas indoligenes]